MTRRRRVPEIVQTSAMDCGPACLAAMLAGHGVTASYDRLREACQTDVDGTSIDTIEDAAVQLGLDAEQVIVPVEHVLLDEAASLPAIAITRLPSDDNHFVVVWSCTSRRVQVMDPAVGRRWIPRRRFLDELYIHTMDVPTQAWREWASSEEMRGPLAQRMVAIGSPDAEATIDRALADPGWRPIAALDAAVRMVQSLIDADALNAGTAAAKLVDSLVQDDRGIPEDFWSARASEDPDQLRVRGAVLVRVASHTANGEPASPELRAALDEQAPQPWRHIVTALFRGRVVPLALVAAIVASSILLVIQAALWRALFDTSELTTIEIAGALATLVVFLGVEFLVDSALAATIQRLGRRLELGLRAQFLASISRLGLRYLASRPISDMAERSHALHRLGELPSVGTRLVKVALNAVLTGIALIWLAPEATWLVVALAIATIAPPLLGHRRLVEYELRVRTHHGALATFYLDALLGAVPAAAHGAERAMRREHEARLVEWVRAAQREHALATAISCIQAALIAGFAIWLVVTHAASTSRPASILLLVYWTVGMAMHGASLAGLVRELPAHRNLTLRLLEPLGARGGDDGEVVPGANTVGPGAIVFDHVSVIAGGHTILKDVTTTIAEGEHVAVVGLSGAGKSTLLGLLLGWHRPAIGTISIGGQVLDGPTIAALRTRTAWVDPAVQLWNDSLAANLTFGARGAPNLGATVLAAQLDGVLARLPEGMQTRLGEGGGLVSGGEGQRVRFGRALLRDRAALVVLDEPFRGLDRDRRRELLDAAREKWRGVTLLCATHDLAETQAFDRVLVIEDGALVEDGSPRELAARASSRYAALLAVEISTVELWSRWRGVELDAGRVVRP